MATPAAIFRQIWKQLDAAEKSNAQWEAKQLVAHVCGLNPVTLGGGTKDHITQQQLDDLTDLTARRVNGEPLAHLLGSTQFYDLHLHTPPGVLIPRADTEILVDCVLAKLDDQPRYFWDIGTGTGAISLALLSQRSAWHGVASDISATAVETAKGNARQLKLAHRLQVVQGDGTEAIDESLRCKTQTRHCAVRTSTTMTRDTKGETVIVVSAARRVC